ncbi:MAG TPA: hypothetical protein VEL31_04375 [Ktedonobacteraceae bacterium]|nr:hypothetical protein [Ktedonobacteraceae bacterium]
MGLLDKMNPFKGRQPGTTGVASTGVKVKGQRLTVKEANKIAADVLKILRNHPDITDEKLMEVLSLEPTANSEACIATGRAAYEKEQLLSTEPTTGPLQGNGANGTAGVRQVQHGKLTLITFSGEELLRQVEERRSRVSFDLSGTAKFMDNFNQVWSWVGPILFALGTIGEIFLVLWERQKRQDWFTAGTIVAVSMIAEGTLLAISFTAKRLRNRADKRSTGWTDKEKHKLEVLQRFWFALALGVAATQVAFVVAQTDPKDIGIGAVWVIAIVRSLAALVADAYTAFVSEEKPTSGELAIEQQDKETEFTKKVLEQTAVEVETINAGAIKVQEVGIEAEMRQDRMNTQKEIAKLQNKAQIETMEEEQRQKVLIDRMRNSAMRAIFDPEMPPQQRQAIISMLTGLMGATKELPSGGTTITPEEDD